MGKSLQDDKHGYSAYSRHLQPQNSNHFDRFASLFWQKLDFPKAVQAKFLQKPPQKTDSPQIERLLSAIEHG